MTSPFASRNPADKAADLPKFLAQRGNARSLLEALQLHPGLGDLLQILLQSDFDLLPFVLSRTNLFSLEVINQHSGHGVHNSCRLPWILVQDLKTKARGFLVGFDLKVVLKTSHRLAETILSGRVAGT